MSAESTPPAPSEILGQMIFGKCVTMALSVAAKLRIADKVAAGAKSADELGTETGTHGPTLYRVLRALSGLGVFSESADGKFSLTPMGELLRSDVPGSMRGMADFVGDK